ncbi:MAG TPA: hypothetical protein VMW54_12200 [Terriglobia bacterium]|nr:hypothetical protein [Terriglobia bacterium]
METTTRNNKSKTPAEITLQFDIKAQTPFRPQESKTLKGFTTIAVYYGPELFLRFDVSIFDNEKSRWAKLPQKLGKHKAFAIVEASKKLHELIEAVALDEYEKYLRSNRPDF